MAARRCSLHGINFPSTVMRCPVCDEATDWMGSIEPDEEWQLAVELLAAQKPISEADRIERWRLERCLDLGYSVDMAESIAASDGDLYVLEYRLIRRGCSLKLAARII